MSPEKYDLNLHNYRLIPQTPKGKQSWKPKVAPSEPQPTQEQDIISKQPGDVVDEQCIIDCMEIFLYGIETGKLTGADAYFKPVKATEEKNNGFKKDQ